MSFVVVSWLGLCVWQKGLWCCFTFWVSVRLRKKKRNDSKSIKQHEKRWLLKKKTPEQNDWRFFSFYHCFLNFLFVFWCLKLLCVKKRKKKTAVVTFWPCVQCNIENTSFSHLYFVLISQPICLSVCLSSCPSPFIRRNLQPTKQEIFLFYILFLFLWNTTLREKKNLNRKNNETETENTKKKRRKKEKLKQSCHTSHNTKLKGTWEESGTCESSKMHI